MCLFTCRCALYVQRSKDGGSRLRIVVMFAKYGGYTLLQPCSNWRNQPVAALFTTSCTGRTGVECGGGDAPNRGGGCLRCYDACIGQVGVGGRHGKTLCGTEAVIIRGLLMVHPPYNWRGRSLLSSFCVVALPRKLVLSHIQVPRPLM